MARRLTNVLALFPKILFPSRISMRRFIQFWESPRTCPIPLMEEIILSRETARVRRSKRSWLEQSQSLLRRVLQINTPLALKRDLWHSSSIFMDAFVVQRLRWVGFLLLVAA